jgi:outer membrane protein OmpA-like peptidoglycan-associated protein
VPPIKSKFSQNSVEIERGDSAKIFWEFSDVDFVIVSDFNSAEFDNPDLDKLFNAIDSLFVAPDSSTVYKVTATDGFKQKLTIDWYVTVVEPTIPTFDINLLDDDFRSISPSPNISPNDKVNSISIVGSNTANNNDYSIKYSIKFVPYDADGKFVNEVFFDKNNLRVIAPNSKTTAPQIAKIDAIMNDDCPINFCICIDNSSAGTRNQNIINAIHSASNNFPLSDNFYFSYFNQNFGGVELIRRNNVTGEFDEVFKRIPAPSGFSAINKSVGQAMNYMLAKTVGKNVIIIIANSADNASVLYDENDLIEHSQKNNIPIYVIAVGASVPTYNLANLTSRTGGKIYHLTENESSLLPHFLNEIILSQKQYYSVDFSANNFGDDDYFDIELVLEGGDNAVFKDKYSFPLKTQKIFSEYQVLASFKLGDTLLDESFSPAISNLAEVLISNPDLVVELIGNSGAIEGNDDICRRIALRRAQAVRKKLIEEGANPVQIRVSSEGAARPLFQTPKLDWQFRYNNRVEIRWLLPEELPFEIIADYRVSEDDAQSNVENWEDKGYKAYYQRIMRNNRPAYRTLLWGYSTEKTAEDDAKKLSREYRREFVLR